MSSQSKRLYQFGPFRLDTSERLLLRNEEIVKVTPKAFDILIALIESSGHLLEKDDLMKAIWPDTFVDESTLTSNISTLRKALEIRSSCPSGTRRHIACSKSPAISNGST